MDTLARVDTDPLFESHLHASAQLNQEANVQDMLRIGQGDTDLCCVLEARVVGAQAFRETHTPWKTRQKQKLTRIKTNLEFV